MTIATKILISDIDVGRPRWEGDKEDFDYFEVNGRKHTKEERRTLKEGSTHMVRLFKLKYREDIDIVQHLFLSLLP